VQNHRHDNEQRNTDTTAITAPPPFREHDDIFVLNNKVSHPAKFIEYVRSDDTARDCIFAIVRYNTSSSVAQVPVRLLQLMRNTSRLRSSTKSNHSTNTDPQPTIQLRPHSIAQQNNPPTAHSSTGSNSDSSGNSSSDESESDENNQATTQVPTIQQAPHPTQPPPKGKNANSKENKFFRTLNNGHYRMSNEGQFFTSWICQKFKLQHNNDPPSDFSYDINDVQNIRRSGNFNSNDWVFTRCQAKFHVYPNNRIEYVRAHNCSTTYPPPNITYPPSNNMVDERPHIMTMSPFRGHSLTSSSTRWQLRNMIIKAPGLWEPVYGGHDMRFHAPDIGQWFTPGSRCNFETRWNLNSLRG